MEGPMIPAFKYEFELPNDEFKSDSPKDAEHIASIHKYLISPLGVENGDDNGAESTVEDGEDQEEENLEKLFSGLQKRLEKRRLKALEFVMASLVPKTDHPTGKLTRSACAQVLVNWVSSFCFVDSHA
jgi:hypothetical protein